MRARSLAGSVVGMMIVLGAWSAPGRAGLAQPQQPRRSNENRTTKEELERWMTELSNWGRWGQDDQLGAVNTITAAKRQEAATLAKSGLSVSLAHDLITEAAPDAQTPYVLRMMIFPERQVTRDRIDIDFHGGTFTHLDALCHVAYNGKFYNGINYETATNAGCARMGINGLKDGLVTRGVLIDIPRLKGVPFLEPGTHVYREDIEAWERQAGVKVRPGDAILLRTGRWARRAKLGPGAGTAGGYDASFLPFLKDRDVALIGGDSAQDVGTVPGCATSAPSPTICWLPVHKFALVARGMNIFDNLDLEAAAETAAQLKRWEFLLMAAPVRISGGTGSPINPIAVF
jgi:kynurenine formamidase